MKWGTHTGNVVRKHTFTENHRQNHARKQTVGAGIIFAVSEVNKDWNENFHIAYSGQIAGKYYAQFIFVRGNKTVLIYFALVL